MLYWIYTVQLPPLVIIQVSPIFENGFLILLPPLFHISSSIYFFYLLKYRYSPIYCGYVYKIVKLSEIIFSLVKSLCFFNSNWPHPDYDDDSMILWLVGSHSFHHVPLLFFQHGQQRGWFYMHGQHSYVTTYNKFITDILWKFYAQTSKSNHYLFKNRSNQSPS